MRDVLIESAAFEDLQFWAKNDLKLLKKIMELIADIQKSPYAGIGKPEALKHDYKGYWSRRINDEHRLIYKITEGEVIIAGCRYHYNG
ncbi:MAG: toxin-antitoxin system, toxin component, Txe/YoeB family [Bacteroidetes bacterium]|nr:toxin-antitoxin system, toxin component, Txe/YoeB family [Bacteroidota bacterium]